MSASGPSGPLVSYFSTKTYFVGTLGKSQQAMFSHFSINPYAEATHRPVDKIV